MEILGHGNLYERHSYTRSCPVCNCIFKCTQDDFNKDSRYMYAGALAYKVNCPECGHSIGIMVDMYDEELVNDG